MVMDLFELVVFVISRCGILVRFVMIGLSLMFLLSVRGSGCVLLLKGFEVRIFCSIIFLWCVLGSLMLMMVWFGMVLMCVDSVDIDRVMLLESLIMWLVFSFGVGFSL